MANKAESIHRKSKPGRKPSLSAEHVLALRAIVAERPQAALAEVTAELARRCGVKVNPVTVRKALRQAGVVRDKPVRRSSVQRAAQGQARSRRCTTGCASSGASALASRPSRPQRSSTRRARAAQPRAATPA